MVIEIYKEKEKTLAHLPILYYNKEGVLIFGALGLARSVVSRLKLRAYQQRKYLM